MPIQPCGRLSADLAEVADVPASGRKRHETASCSMNSHPLHFTGYGIIADDEETRELKIAMKLCMIMSNAPKGYARVYVRNDKCWIGPYRIKGEFAELRA